MAKMSEMDSQTLEANREGSATTPTANTETVEGGSNENSPKPGDKLKSLRTQLK